MVSMHQFQDGQTQIDLLGAPDETIGHPALKSKTVQVMQIELARETVREMQKYVRLGKGVKLSIGKSPVSIRPNMARVCDYAC